MLYKAISLPPVLINGFPKKLKNNMKVVHKMKKIIERIEEIKFSTMEIIISIYIVFTIALLVILLNLVFNN